jgi:hypothetical protein
MGRQFLELPGRPLVSREGSGAGHRAGTVVGSRSLERWGGGAAGQLLTVGQGTAGPTDPRVAVGAQDSWYPPSRPVNEAGSPQGVDTRFNLPYDPSPLDGRGERGGARGMPGEPRRVVGSLKTR